MAPTQTSGADTHLLILPALESPLQRSELWAAYERTFSSILSKVKPADLTIISRLDVAISLSSPSVGVASSRSLIYAEIQHILQETYTLSVSCASKANVELDIPGGVDVRIFFLDARAPQTSSLPAGHEYFCGPLVDYRTFATSKRRYQNIYTVDGEAGEDIVTRLNHLIRENGGDVPSVERLPMGVVPARDSTVTQAFHDRPTSAITHRSVINGGTFDHLHIGHKLLLTATVFVADPGLSPSAQQGHSGPYHRKITIGTTGDELLVNKKHASLVESWDTRQSRTADFLESILVFHPDLQSPDSISAVRHVEHIDNPGPNGKIVRVTYSTSSSDETVTVDYTRISDPYGPTITEPDISAIVVSGETRAGGKAVNEERAKKGWTQLEVFEVEVLDASASIETGQDGQSAYRQKDDFTNKISSTEIRKRLENNEKGSTKL